MDRRGQILSHGSGFDGFNADLFKRFGKGTKLLIAVDPGTVLQARGPGKDAGNRVRAGFFALLMLATIAIRFNGSRAQERQNQKQAQAIQAEVQQKVEEIKPLTEGNLSRDLTATHGITQPIAVAVNQLLAWMRSVVTSVNNSSAQVRDAVEASSKASGEVKTV